MSMRFYKTTWPIIGVLGCLFVLSATLPHGWQFGQSDSGKIAVNATSGGNGTATYAASPQPRSANGLEPRESIIPPPIISKPNSKPRPAAPAAIAIEPSPKLGSFVDARPERSALRLLSLGTESGASSRPTAPTILVADQVKAEVGQQDVAKGDSPIFAETKIGTVPSDQPTARRDGSQPGPELRIIVQPPEKTPVTLTDSKPQPLPATTINAEPPRLPTSPALIGSAPKGESAKSKETEKPAGPAVDAKSLWPLPTSLLRWLEGLASQPQTSDWAGKVQRLVRDLGTAVSVESKSDAGVIIAKLLAACPQVDGIALHIADEPLARNLRRTAFAVTRRAAVWKQALVALKAEPRAKLLDAVEQFEETGLPSRAAALADAARKLAGSPSSDEHKLGVLLQETYGCGNVRLAISRQLLNRLMPRRPAEYAPVNDKVLGLSVQGNSVATSDIEVQYFPDPNHLRLAFLVSGKIDSVTSSSSGPASFVTGSEARYIARKQMEIEAAGIRLQPTEVWIRSASELRELETAFDEIPLIGALARAIARNQHAQSQPAALQEVEQKISDRARRRIDSESYAQLNRALDKMRDRGFTPLERMHLRPLLVSGETTEERMVMRFRLAAEGQLGSAAPRPQAPSDSLASVQIHETAANNFLTQLELDGRHFTLPELSRHVATRLNRPSPWATDPEHDDVTITFAAKDALSVRFRQGQLGLTLAIAKLEAGRRMWKDFRVLVFYRPEVSDASAELVRDGVIQLIGPRLNGTGQIAVRGIFAKTFPKNGHWNLLPDRFLHDENLKDLGLTQVEIEDGWIGLAIGPRRAAVPAILVNRPSQGPAAR